MAGAPIASLDDMMLALHKADIAGNSTDATGIAQMIQRDYPDHVQAAFKLTPPPTNNAPLDSDVANPAGWAPARQIPYGQAHPIGVSGGVPGMAPTAQTAQDALGQGGDGAGPGGGSGPAAPNPASGAPNGPNGLAAVGDDLRAVARGWVGSLPGGNWLAAGLGTAMRHPLGFAMAQEGDDIRARKAQIDAAQQADAQQSPIASGAGNLIGTGVALGAGGGLLSKGAAMAADAGLPVVSTLAKGANAFAGWAGKSTSFVPNIVRSMTAGGVGGLGQAAVDVANGSKSVSDLPYDAAVDAGFGAIAGPVLGLTASRAWDAMAKKFTGLLNSGALDGVAGEAANFLLRKAKVTGDDLEKTFNAMKGANGGVAPSFADVLPAHAQAIVRNAAGDTPDLGNALLAAKSQAASDAQINVSKMLDDASSATKAAGSPTGSAGVQRIGQLEAARDAQMSHAMHGGPDPIADQRVALQPGDEDILGHKDVQSSLRGNTDYNSEVDYAVTAMTQHGQKASLPTGMLDSLRQKLASKARAPGGGVTPDSESAAQALAGLKSIYERNPNYVAALAKNAKHNATIEGYNHGRSGNAIADIQGAQKLADNAATGSAYTQGHGSGFVSALSDKAKASPAGAKAVLADLNNDPATLAQIAANHGQPAATTLQNAAQRLQKAQDSLSAIAPKSAVAGAEAVDHTVEHGVIAAAFHHPVMFLANAAKMVSSSANGKLSDQAAQRLASMLLDPNGAQAAINILRKQGASEANLARIRGYASAAAGIAGAQMGNGS